MLAIKTLTHWYMFWTVLGVLYCPEIWHPMNLLNTSCWTFFCCSVVDLNGFSRIENSHFSLFIALCSFIMSVSVLVFSAPLIYLGREVKMWLEIPLFLRCLWITELLLLYRWRNLKEKLGKRSLQSWWTNTLLLVLFPKASIVCLWRKE